MSRVTLIAANHALPLCAPAQEANGPLHGFQAAEHCYYRDAADALGFEMKPFRYELSLERTRACLDRLLAHLRENLSPGETAELWSLWVGEGGGARPRRYRGRLSEFDLDTLGMLTELSYEPDPTGEFPEGLISQICITVEI